jgi:hypothetical protein
MKKHGNTLLIMTFDIRSSSSLFHEDTHDWATKYAAYVATITIQQTMTLQLWLSPPNTFSKGILYI